MAKPVNAIPEGYNTVTPCLVVRDAEKAIEFYKKALGAEETVRLNGPGGKILHAEVRIGNSVVMMGEEDTKMGAPAPQTLNGSPVSMMIYTHDVDAAFKRAVSAGATVEMPPQDMFWGDRYGKLKDPFGHQWAIATHKEDLTPKQMETRFKEFLAKQEK